MKYKMKGFVVAITKPQLRNTKFQLPRYVKRNRFKTEKLETMPTKSNGTEDTCDGRSATEVSHLEPHKRL
jgi:hypothetical protein